MHLTKPLAVLLVAICVMVVGVAFSPTALATDHGEEICSDSDAESYDTSTVYVNTVDGAYININGGEDTCPVNVEDPNNIGDLTEIEQAVIAVDYGGEVIIEEHSNFGDVDTVSPENMMYSGAVIGTQENQNAVLNNGKELTIKGEEGGISIVKAKDGEKAPFVFADNNNEQVTIENLVLAEGERALHVKSNSNVILESSAVDGSVESANNDFGHILFEDSILDSLSTGSIVRTSENYYPDDASSQVSNVRDVAGDQIDILEPNPSLDVNNPSAFIFERQDEPLDYNPVVAGNYYYSGPVIVDGDAPNSDDDKIATPFKTLDAAMTAAGVRTSDSDIAGDNVGGNVIEVRPTTGSYGEATVDGIGVPSRHSLSIVGSNGAPVVESIKFAHPGSYNIEDLHIGKNVETVVSGVELDASNVYWGITSDSDQIRSERVINNPSSTVNISPWCEDSNCDSYTYDNFENGNACVLVSGVGYVTNCPDGTSDLEIDISFDDTSGDQGDLRTGTMTVEKKESLRGQTVEVDADIVQSSQQVDGSIRLPAGQQFGSTMIQSDFSSIRDRSSVSGDISFNPSVVGTVTMEDDNDNAQSISFGQSLSEVVQLSEIESDASQDTELIDDSAGNGTGVVQDTEIIGLIENQTTFVTSFNAGTSQSAFEDNTIPPVSINEAGYVEASRGEMRDFGNARIENQRPATLQPNDGWNTGFAIESLPPAKNHVLNIKYAYQADLQSQNNIDLSIVDSSDEKIYTGRPSDVETLEPTVGTGVDPYESGLSSSATETREVSIPLHDLETQYIRDTGNIYVTLENSDYQDQDEEQLIFLLYEMSIDSTDNTSAVSDPGGTIDDDAPGSEPVPGDIDVEVNVENADFNDEYDTYDVEPGSELQYELVFENLGDTAVSGTFDVDDTHYLESGQFVDENLFNPSQSTETTKLKEDIEVDLGTGEDSTQVEQYTVNWGEADFGRHEVRINRTDLEEEDSGNVGYNTYVLQETTPEITNIEIPEEHVTYDGINAEVSIQNIGDLSGDVTINSEFGNWESVDEVTLPEGDTREGITSSNVTISYLRSEHPEPDTPLFNRREYTTPSEVLADQDGFEITSVMFDETSTHGNGDTVYYRPNAPFSTEKGENTFTTTVESQINLEERTEQVGSSSALTDVDNNVMELGQIKIDDFLVNTDPTAPGTELSNKPTAEEATVYASAWPYVHPSMSDMILARPYADHDNPTLEGERTMFSYADPSESAVNRGSFPINHPNIGMTSQPSDRYLSHSFSTLNRVCNPNLLENNGASMVNQDEATEGDADNNFVAFSARSCDDENRITELQPVRFVDTTNGGEVTTDSRFEDAGIRSVDLQEHPDPYSISGVNAETFEDIDEDGTVMMAKVRMSNPVNTEYTTTARLEIVTNKTLDNSVVGIGGPSGTHVEVGSERFDSNVVGAAAVRIRPDEEVAFNVPIVLRNNENAGGVHELSVRTRASAEGTEDYLEFGGGTDEQSSLTESPITGEEYDRFTIPVKVETYGDAVLNSFEPADSMPTNDVSDDDTIAAQAADTYAYSVCKSDYSDSIDSRVNASQNFKTSQGTYSTSLVEGLNPRSGTNTDNPIQVADGVSQEVGDCESGISSSDETVTMEATYTNYGGEEIEIRPELIAEFETRPWHSILHRQNSHATGDRYFADYASDGDTNLSIQTWSERPGTVTLEPGEQKTVTFERRFQEPGLYHLRVSPCRDISSSGPQQYNQEGFTGIPETIPAETPSADPGHWTTTRHGIDRTDYELDSPNARRYNAHSTPEMENSVFHGSRGCAEEVSSVFVYDSTKPVADFRRAHDETTIMNNTEDHTHATPQSGEFGFNDEVETPEVNIVFAVDDSGSVGCCQEDIRSSIIQFVEEQPRWYDYGFELYHDGGNWRGQDLGSYSDNDEFVNFMESTQIGGVVYGGSRDPQTLEPSINQIQNNAGEGAENYIIVLGDGDELDGNTCDNARSGLKDRDDVTIITVYFGSNCEGSLQDLAYTGPSGDKLHYDSNEDDFISAFNQVAREVIGGGVFEVDEGGMLFIDGSTVNRADCGNCYSRPHFEPYQLETPADSPHFPGGVGSEISGEGEDFREGLRKAEGVVHSHRMSVDNTRIAGIGMPATLSGEGLQDTHPLIERKGMEWTIEGGDPNYGQDRFCPQVENGDPDEHCYMEQFEGGFNEGTGNTPDYYEVVPHRFTDSGERTVQLQVWDDPTLTRGDAHTDIASTQVTVNPDNSDPEASIEHENFNDLSYDQQGSATPNWHRMEGIYANKVSYRSAPDNFNSNSKYDDTYEGTRTCLTTSGSDGQIGIAQDRWSQTDNNELDDGTRFINEGLYVQEGAGYNELTPYSHDRSQQTVDVDMGHTRDGYKRCFVFSEDNSIGSDRDRTHTFQYEVWDYAENTAEDTTEVQVDTDQIDPTVDRVDPEYDTATGNSPSGTDNGWVWAYSEDVGLSGGYHGGKDFAGDDVQFDIAATDNGDGIGIACLDVRLEVGSGPSYQGSSIHGNCQSMGDESSGSPDYEGTHGNTAGTGAETIVGSSQTPGEYSGDNYFSSVELGSNYKLPSTDPSSDGEFTTSEDVHAVDWHGNHDKDTVDIDVKYDGTPPSLSGSYSCSGNSCDTDTFSFNSQGPDGGTPIVDAKVKSVSGSLDSCDITGDDSGSDCSYSGTSASVTSLDTKDFSGEVEVDVTASVDADASVESASCSGCGDSDSTSVDVDADASGEVTVVVMDAHGNTAEITDSWSISDSDSDDDSCSNPPCEDDA